jgi:hypothetical protein
MWDGARSAIVLGMNYGPSHDPMAILGEPTRGAISVYAQGDDYHELIKGRLKVLARWLQARFGGELKVFVDTAPLLEKPLADRRAGWQGKHTNLVSQVRLLAVRARSDHPGADARPAEPPLRLPRLPGHLPDERLPGPTSWTLHLLPDHRAEGADPASSERPTTASTAATTAGRVPEQVPRRPRTKLQAPGPALAALPASTTRLRALRQEPGQGIGRDRFVRSALRHR